jgi:uncharacterized protein (DUF1499 family)|tara:strand:- start:299 stop:703 length:405 start_codon:yes stop_codon:yes gene_type:complete
MCDNLHLNSISQCATPLNKLFFSAFNVNLVQRGIRQSFKNKTGVKIDYQNEDDVYGIMRVVFINNAGNHNEGINEQVKSMNTIAINTAVSQIQTGVSQYMGYVHDIDKGMDPINRPVSTSTYGNKIGKSDKIGV